MLLCRLGTLFVVLARFLSSWNAFCRLGTPFRALSSWHALVVLVTKNRVLTEGVQNLLSSLAPLRLSNELPIR